MTRFSVDTDALTAAAVLTAGADDDLDTAAGNVQGAAAALDDTPAMFAYSAFTSAAGTATSGQQTCAQELSRALNAAALAYRLADEASAAALKVNDR